MRFAVLIKTTPQTENDANTPGSNSHTAWAELTDDLTHSGALLAGGVLTPVDTGARVTITPNEVIVMDGPFAETTELITHVWVLQAATREEALNWVRRIPTHAHTQVEVRSIIEGTATDTPRPGGVATTAPPPGTDIAPAV